VICFRKSVQAGIYLGACLFLSACQPAGRLAPLESDAVLLAFGDSLTFGTGVSPDKSYPAVLSNLIGRQVVAAGIPGEISTDGQKRLGGLLKRHQPDVLILCHGGNDILRRMDAKQTEDNLRAMVELARAADVEVVMLAVPAFGLFPKPAGYYDDLERDLNVPIEMDILADLEADRSMKSDQVHFNEAGYRRMAEAVKALLEKEGAL
tara:strand:+ start:33005 stop:33625 length:621 start_codon:yes stop_codon:yes gene_type:complete